ncbi:MAG: VWA domain-containing protein [Nitratireductor sp.]|nr:VWA domain-containing protein [Nitratireductor sp.]
MIFALALIPVMLGAGVAVDYSKVSREKSSLQNALDAAILAVGQEFESMGKAAVNRALDEYLRANLDAESYKRIAKVSAKIDKKTHTLTATASGNIATSFMMLAGHESMSYDAVSQISAAFGGAEVALVLDNTGSMGVDGKLQALKSAASSFVNGLITKSTGTRTKIGIVPFSNHVNVGLANRNAKWLDLGTDGSNWRGCVGSRHEPLNLEDRGYGNRVPGVSNITCSSEILPLSNDKRTVLAKIATMSAEGATYIPAGLIWGQRVLSDIEPFSEGVSKAIAKRDNIKKYLVLMTDGDNTRSAQLPDLPTHLGENRAQANEWTAAGCATIKKDDITIYTITFGTLTEETKTLMRDCATAPSNYFHAASGRQLNEIFSAISSQISALHLSM